MANRTMLFALLVLVLPGMAGRCSQSPFAPPDALGPFAVGHTSFSLQDPEQPGRWLLTDVWYPVDPGDALGETTVYALPSIEIHSEAAIEAVPASGVRRFPLVVFSHGTGGVRFQSYFLAEALASHGFVVAAPDHPGNTLLEHDFDGPLYPEAIASERPRDLSLVIDRMLQRSASVFDPLYQRIHPLRIGAAGHSFGGFSALAAGGGYGELAQDARVGAILAISPAASLLSDAELSSIGVPALVLGGDLDSLTPLDPESARTFALVGADTAYRVDIAGAAHLSFTNACDLVDALVSAGGDPGLIAALVGPFFASQFDVACGGSVLPAPEVHRTTNLYAVSFFRLHLDGDLRYAGFLREAYTAAHEPNATLLRRTGP